jgi:hypothetical protein
VKLAEGFCQALEIPSGAVITEIDVVARNRRAKKRSGLAAEARPGGNFYYLNKDVAIGWNRIKLLGRRLWWRPTPCGAIGCFAQKVAVTFSAPGVGSDVYQLCPTIRRCG